MECCKTTAIFVTTVVGVTINEEYRYRKRYGRVSEFAKSNACNDIAIIVYNFSIFDCSE